MFCFSCYVCILVLRKKAEAAQKLKGQSKPEVEAPLIAEVSEVSETTNSSEVSGTKESVQNENITATSDESQVRSFLLA